MADDSKPEFVDAPSIGYIPQSAFDNNILSVVTEDEEGKIPLKLTVSDADDPQVNLMCSELSRKYVTYHSEELFDVGLWFGALNVGLVEKFLKTSQFRAQNVKGQSCDRNCNVKFHFSMCLALEVLK